MSVAPRSSGPQVMPLLPAIIHTHSAHAHLISMSYSSPILEPPLLYTQKHVSIISKTAHTFRLPSTFPHLLVNGTWLSTQGCGFAALSGGAVSFSHALWPGDKQVSSWLLGVASTLSSPPPSFKPSTSTLASSATLPVSLPVPLTDPLPHFMIVLTVPFIF